MSFLKDAGKSFLKYSEKFVEKTEEYTKIARLILDIKRYESDIEKIQNEIGAYAVLKADEGSKLNLGDKFIKAKIDRVHELKGMIDEHRKNIEEIKKAGTAEAGPKTTDFTDDANEDDGE